MGQKLVWWEAEVSSADQHDCDPLLVERERPTIEINPDTTCVSIKLPSRAAVALDAIWQRYRQRNGI